MECREDMGNYKYYAVLALIPVSSVHKEQAYRRSMVQNVL